VIDRLGMSTVHMCQTSSYGGRGFGPRIRRTTSCLLAGVRSIADHRSGPDNKSGALSFNSISN
jgi:hypothetical protein